MLVTDITRLKGGRDVTGFYMQGFLRQNLDDIPAFLKKSWDCVCIVSGHGKVRIGKSTLAAQVGFYIAWLLAGGEMKVNEKNQAIGVIKPTSPVRFNLKDNVVFSAEDLQDRATTLYKKYGKNQVIMYDEGRQGLDSARAMESINKGMEDFLQECGFMGHVIIIVLPNFFKLHEDYAVARSLFLIDVFADQKYNRGYFNFYNEKQKEHLFYFGKKRIGVTAKYMATNESFWGKFTPWLPFDKDEYEDMKKEAIERKAKTRREKNLRLQRDVLVWLANKKWNVTMNDIKREITETIDLDIGLRTLSSCSERITDIISKQKGYT